MFTRAHGRMKEHLCDGLFGRAGFWFFRSPRGIALSQRVQALKISIDTVTLTSILTNLHFHEEYAREFTSSVSCQHLPLTNLTFDPIYEWKKWIVLLFYFVFLWLRLQLIPFLFLGRVKTLIYELLLFWFLFLLSSLSFMDLWEIFIYFRSKLLNMGALFLLICCFWLNFGYSIFLDDMKYAIF